MSGHTPGPWKVIHDMIYREKFSTAKEGLTSIAKVKLPPRARVVTGEHAANARLIAAAPELLSIVEALVSMRDESDFTHEGAYEAFHKGGAEEVWERARAAIAKVRGK
jgi:hypothetical protein